MAPELLREPADSQATILLAASNFELAFRTRKLEVGGLIGFDFSTSRYVSILRWAARAAKTA